MKHYLTVPLLVGPLVLALAACGSGDARPRGTAVPQTPPSTAATSPATGPTTSPATGPAVSTTTKANPAPVPDGRASSATSSTPPLLWPATTSAELRRLQDATLEGHQPWLCDPAAVVQAYGRGPLNWPEPTVRRLHGDVYEMDGPAGARATVTVFKAAGRGCVWEITAVQRG